MHHKHFLWAYRPFHCPASTLDQLLSSPFKYMQNNFKESTRMQKSLGNSPLNSVLCPLHHMGPPATSHHSSCASNADFHKKNNE